jgi:PII-like signaling protein
LISKIILGLLSVIILFQAHQIYADEELPIIKINFVSGKIIDLDESPQMIRAEIQIQNYNPQDGYHFMEVTRVSDGEIIKDTEILPRYIGGDDDNLFGVQILHYIEPGANETNMIGDYVLRIYSEYGSSESVSTFSIIKSSMPVIVTQNIVEESEELVTPEELTIPDEIITPDEEVEDIVESAKIPSWVHDIFVWYAEESISENELLASLEYLITEGILNVDFN